MKKITLLIISFITLLGFFSSQAQITDCKVSYGEYTDNTNVLYFTLRSYKKNNTAYYLVVNPTTLTTSVVKASDATPAKSSLDQLRKKYPDVAYIKALAYADAHAKELQDAGITHSFPQEAGISLTIDLCPSSKPLDRVIFLDLIKEFHKVQKPVPVALSLSGTWIIKHEKDLSWLDSLDKAGDLDITWVNHTFTHPTSKTLPLSENFLLEKNINISDEVLKNEALILSKGYIPSVFFRFPGLVSDQSIFLQVTSFGVIPIGSDAWLAKGQKPHDGSFVLIHGNGNEPIGVKDFIQLLQQENINVKDRNWKLYDLKGSVIGEVK